MKLAIVLLSAGLAGCGTMGLFGNTDNAMLNVEQMKAMASDKNANAFCGIASGPWGKVITTYVVVDKSVLSDGGFSVDDSCKVQLITNRAPPRVVPVTPIAPVVP